MPSTAGSAFSRAIRVSSASSEVSAGRRIVLRCDAGSGRGAVLAAHIDRAGRIIADQHHREPRAERQGCDCGRPSVARSAAAIALPSMIRALTGPPVWRQALPGRRRRAGSFPGWSRRRPADRRWRQRRGPAPGRSRRRGWRGRPPPPRRRRSAGAHHRRMGQGRAVRAAVTSAAPSPRRQRHPAGGARIGSKADVPDQAELDLAQQHARRLQQQDQDNRADVDAAQVGQEIADRP